MRVLRTEMYFEESDVEWRHGKIFNPGITAAWFVTRPAGPPSLEQLYAIFDSKIARRVNNPLEEFGRLGDFFVQGLTGSELVGELDRTGKPANLHIVEHVLNSEIAYQRNPIEGLELRKILKGSSIAVLGVFIGKYATPVEHPALILVYAPLGILLVCAAVGAGVAFGNGVNKKIKRLFD